MDSNLQPPPPDGSNTKTAFRKPSNDAANRKYRRRSPVGGSSSSEGSDHNSSPVISNEDTAKDSEHRSRRKDDRRERDRDSTQSHHDRNGDSYRHHERRSSRSSHNYSRQDDLVKPDKDADDTDRNYERYSSRSGWESRGSSRSSDRYSRDGYDGSGYRIKDKDKESHKYKDRDSSFDRAGPEKRHADPISEEMSRDRRRRDRNDRDGKRDYFRSSEDHKSHRMASYEESRGHRHDSSSGRDNDKYRFKGDKKYDELEACRDKDQNSGAPVEQFEKKSLFAGANEESPAKKPKHFSSGKDTDYGKDADEKQASGLDKAQEGGSRVTAGEVHGNESVTNDLNAAKVAAMKAAELVNKNLVGVGFMTADQKKKLLWGNKKNATTEEAGHHWDTAMIGDRERQEKFNKLMGVKGELKVEQKTDNQDGNGHLQAEKQIEQLQLDLEKQYTAGLRRRDGRTVGLGL